MSTMTAPTPPRARGRLREALDYFLWFYTPFRKMTAEGIYDLVSTKSFSACGLYLNLGYWKTARTIDDACEAMAVLVADTATMGPGDQVVDVGFGFADQDMLWMEKFAPAHITGLNITRSQVELARERVAERGMADRITLLEASATQMPLAADSCDKVVGVECAFHFQTREAFFAEAHRVLRPGGRLVLADVVRREPAKGRWRRMMQNSNWKFFVKKYAVPEENSDYRETYAAKLRAAQFQNVTVVSIRTDVYPGLHRFMRADPSMLKRFHPLARLPYLLALRFDADSVYCAYDYILASADKAADQASEI